ncbi:MAG: LD-carboxypeptidase [Cyanobacteria bacterium REEB67]|nr:LD-carboxypeptidase [Cyanobacteria bacterium REEB67]
MSRPVKPRVLKKGDTVGIITPSSPTFEPGTLQFSLDRLRKIGLNYKLGPNLSKSYSSYAGSDQARLDDFHTLWSDTDIKAILPLRGGAGAPRLLPGLDFKLIARYPKILCGFSDITGLLIPIHQVTGLVTFHGPTLGLMYENAYTHSYYLKALMSTAPIGAVGDPSDLLTGHGSDCLPDLGVDSAVEKEDWGFEYPARMVIAEGSARGRLTGGCLTLIRGLMGTPWEIDCKDRIVFIEDVDEEPHTIDRMLSQLILAGKFDQAAGIVIGDCSGCRPGGSKRNVLSLNYSLETMLRERLGQLAIPVVYGLKIGHTIDKVTLPLGVMATLTATTGGVVTFSIDEAACVDD